MPGSSITQLIYISNSVHFSDEKELQNLLKASRKNNASLGVTGMLLFHEGSFLQILEGDDAAIKSLYNKIKSDSRHRACRILASIDSNKREFAQWSMGYQKPDVQLALGFSQFMNDLHGYEQARMESEAYKLMLKFREIALKTAA
jgi:hypothetical protein